MIHEHCVVSILCEVYCVCVAYFSLQYDRPFSAYIRFDLIVKQCLPEAELVEQHDWSTLAGTGKKVMHGCMELLLS